jgi:hypothetical protein
MLPNFTPFLTMVYRHFWPEVEWMWYLTPGADGPTTIKGESPVFRYLQSLRLGAHAPQAKPPSKQLQSTYRFDRTQAWSNELAFR